MSEINENKRYNLCEIIGNRIVYFFLSPFFDSYLLLIQQRNEEAEEEEKYEKISRKKSSHLKV